MSHKRLHIRVPVTAEVSLTSNDAIMIEAQAIDISAVGIRVSTPDTAPRPDTEYVVEIKTKSHGVTQFMAKLIHEGEYGAGFGITRIDAENLRSIYKMINDFQGTEEFIHHIDQFCILEDWFVDDNGESLDVVFEKK